MNVRTKTDPGFWQSTQLELMSLHTGTHVESALHSVEGGEAIDEVALDRVIGDAVVLDLTPAESMRILDVADLEKANEKLEAAGEAIRPSDILLLRTDWSQAHIGTHKYFDESPSLTEGAARWIAEKDRNPWVATSSRSLRPGSPVGRRTSCRASGDPGGGHPAHRGAREPGGPATAGPVLRALLRVLGRRERPRARSP
jgi:kynurenine formamidase